MEISKKLFISFMYSLAIFCFAFSFSSAQSDVDSQIKEIRKEYQRINAQLNTFQKVESYFNNGANYSLNQRYTGFIDKNNKLVLLKFTLGEEGYRSDTEYYFKDGNIMFIFTYSRQPDGEESQDRIYFKDKKIIQTLTKLKPAGDNRSINDIENKRTEDTSKIESATKIYLDEVKENLDKFRKGKKQ